MHTSSHERTQTSDPAAEPRLDREQVESHASGSAQDRPHSEHDPVPQNDEQPAEMRTVETLIASFTLVVLGGALLIWAGSAFFAEPQVGADARDPWLPGILGAISLALGVMWMSAGFQKRRNSKYEDL